MLASLLFKVTKLIKKKTASGKKNLLDPQLERIVSITGEKAQWNSWQREHVAGALHILEDQEEVRMGSALSPPSVIFSALNPVG